jgi:ATP-dependent exoDNAse (exonuclease V) beta subunit
MRSERLHPDDAAARRAALDVTDSCIVRAPAGSGKTELLTQRYLALLATVDEPEEIVAITFTRKAAGEMRERIIDALGLAGGPEPAQAHKRVTWELGRLARARDAERGWQLGLHPARMRIQTIDSLDAELTRQMPLLSGFGAPLGVNERPWELYEDAARRTLRLLDEGESPQAAVVEHLARHLDNDLPRIHRLLARMLTRRDQWLRHMGNSRAELEAALKREVDGRLALLEAALPQDCRIELLALAAHAGSVLKAGGVESDIAGWAGRTALPALDASGLALWRGLAEMLLTDKGQWRRVLNKNQGFPPEEAAAKARAMELLRRFEGEEALRTALASVPYLPEPRYADAQWRLLEALLQILPLATAQLRLVFAERGEVDFAEVALGARQALGEPEAPTDLALALDYRIRHLLVDEFQDTSVNQFQRLEMLTAGWLPGDGRTLFLVGDPAQSIYRFREAEVGLFLSAWQSGLGSLRLTPLQLRANFRSRPALVDWYNRVFPGIFPLQADVASGAVPYGDSEARREADTAPAVTVHVLGRDRRGEEAAKIAEIVTAARSEDPEARIAVLVRAKAHLAAIVAALRQAGLHFQAVEIETLGRQPVVQDLLALTRALSHPGDRTAWLAVLRAPWCGLSLAELHGLAAADHDATAPALMAAADALASANPRFAQTRGVLLQALEQGGRGTLREQVEHAWLALGGPAALASEEALADAEAYLGLLEEMEQGGALPSVADLERRLALLFAQPDPEADSSLQFMTVHKAKGLEFETVILPGLDAVVRGEDLDLMVWLERPRAGGGADLLLAPLDAPGQERDALYTWVRLLRRDQERLEQARVLYVAATRAREHLHLLGGVDMKEEEGRRVPADPRPGSPLSLLWPALRAEFERAAEDMQASPATRAGTAMPQSVRLKADWRMPEPEAAVAWRGSTVLAAEQDLEFQWVGETLRHVGTVVHRLLQRIAAEGADHWGAARRREALPRVRQLLTQAGVREEELAAAAADVIRAVENTLGDERGRWLLEPHAQARSEYALSLLRDGRLETGVIDRSFVDADGTRWIVDYKTSRHSGTDVEAFLEQERLRYAPQLERYASLMRGLGAPRVKVALYFPLMQRFLSWEPDHGPEP